MKIYCTLILFLFSYTCGWAAAPWGMLVDYEKNPSDIGYGLPKILAEQPILYVIDENTAKKPESKAGDVTAKIQHNITARATVAEAFSSWFDNAVQHIKQAHREAEFADVMPLLQQGITLKEIKSVDQADVVFHFTTESEVKEHCGFDSIGCHSGKDIFIPFIEYSQLYAEYGDNIQQVLTHEVGHFLGLADQYFHANNASVVHSTSDRIGSRKSVMASSGLGCDDVDGLINIIDWTRARQMNGHYSARAQKGWKSFCDNTRYKEAKVLNKAEFAAEQCFYRFTSSGEIADKICPEPFVKRNRKIEFWDEGLPYSLTDKKQNLFVQYVIMRGNTDEPTLLAFVQGLSSKKDIMRLQAQRTTKAKGRVIVWEIPYHESHAGIAFETDTCTFDSGRMVGGFEFNYMVLNKQLKTNSLVYDFKRDPNVKYKGDTPTLLTDKPIKFRVAANEEAALNKPYSCRIDLEGTEEVFVYEAKQRTKTNEEVVKAVAQRYGISPQELIQAADITCDKEHVFPNKKISDVKDMCSFFYLVDKTYKNFSGNPNL
ncbi:MAG: hypothetical protein J6U96_04345 [Elusimicrobiaceae bacterium]|nr:hypothetical protein [Elusimicrobiaceae bacterium]